jgi:putative DNA primase/helicase
MVRFEEFMHRAWGHDPDYLQKVKLLRQAICMTIFGLGPSFQRAILLFGVQLSGKSRLLDIVRGLMPENSVSVVGPSEWGDKFMPFQMHGKLLNIAGELNEKYPINGSMFKSIIDGTEINGQKKGKDIVKFKPICTHWFGSNHLPKTADTSAGFTRRWAILEFNKKVTDQEKVLGIANQIIAEEREAIVAWAMEEMREFRYATDLSLPPSHERCINDMANMNNSVRYFLATSGRVRRQLVGAETSVRISEEKLYQAYYSSCLYKGGAQPVSSRNFTNKMRELKEEFNFEIEMKKDMYGTEFVEYTNLILVESRGA